TLDASLKAGLLAIVVVTLLRLLNIADSNVRHRVWMGVLVGMIVLPALSRIVPALTLPLYLPLDRLLVVEELPVVAAIEEPAQAERPDEALITSEPAASLEVAVNGSDQLDGGAQF